MINPGTHLVLSRTDALGDVVLTLPLAGFLKTRFPGIKISFLGSEYTRPVVALSQHIDAFLSFDALQAMGAAQRREFLKKQAIDTVVHVFPRKEIAQWMAAAGVKNRIGTSHRLYHLLTCNYRPSFSRKKSELHEAQLNFKLLEPMVGTLLPELETISSYYGFSRVPNLNPDYRSLLNGPGKKIIIHPKSKGSAREWGLDNFSALIKLLPPKEYRVFLSGTEEEGKLFRKHLLDIQENVVDISGTMSLEAFIAFIARCDALVAASTGPLHIAAALGLHAVGIYPPLRPMHPGRWAPLGPRASALSVSKFCTDCKSGGPCHCMAEVLPQRVWQELEKR